MHRKNYNLALANQTLQCKTPNKTNNENTILLKKIQKRLVNISSMSSNIKNQMIKKVEDNQPISSEEFLRLNNIIPIISKKVEEITKPLNPNTSNKDLQIMSEKLKKVEEEMEKRINQYGCDHDNVD